MPPILLKPVRHETPTCESFDDEQAVRDFEVAMRVHRAYTESFTVTPDEQRVDGVYRVSGQSGSAYVVDLVDGSGRNNTCTCPDFLTNEINTCKHLEAVMRALDASPTRKKAYEKLPLIPRTPTLTVDAHGGSHLRLVGKWPELLLGTFGLKRVGLGDFVEPAREDDIPLRPGVQAMGVRVVHAATPVLDRIRAERQRDRRKNEIDTAVERGALGFDVLSKPLFPYQRTGVLHLLRNGRALLADDMGLGKTAQAIAACEVLRARGEAKRILIVTPASLKYQWAREIETFTSEKPVVVSGGSAQRTAALNSDAPYKILNYELTWRELSRLQSLDADILVLDEAQRAKNFRTKTATTLRSIPSRFLFVLTGTPVENRLDDLYSLLQLVDPNILGPLWKFNYEFHRQTDKARVIGYKNLPLLRQRISAPVLRRRKEEVISQLPALTEMTRYTPLSEAQAELEQALRQEASKLLKIAEKHALTLGQQQRLQALLLKARQACDALELADPNRGEQASAKLEEFESVISELMQSGAKVLVFSEWTEMLKLASKRLDMLGIGHSILHGGIPTEKRPALLDRFRQDEDLRVLLSTDAGGVGLNLQVATYVIHLDLPWNPGRLDQRTARAHRVGQTRGVTVIYLCSESGIERGIEGTLRGKRAIRSAALDAQSDVTELEAPSFSVFLKQIQDVLASMDPQASSSEEPVVLAEDVVQKNIDAVLDAAIQESLPLMQEGPNTVRSSQNPAEEVREIHAESPAAPPAIINPPRQQSYHPRVTYDLRPSQLPVFDREAGGTVDNGPASSLIIDREPNQAQPIPPLPKVLSEFAIDAEPPPDSRPGAGGSMAATALAPASPPTLHSSEPGKQRQTSAAALAAFNRLKLARVVLEAGFPADAVRASYDALAKAISSLLEGPALVSHELLVASIYRELLPKGKLPPAAHSALARLHDLVSLEAHGVEVDPGLASDAVAEAEGWVRRLTNSG